MSWVLVGGTWVIWVLAPHKQCGFQDVDMDLSSGDATANVCYFQAVAKKSAEISEKAFAMLNETHNHLCGQRTSIDAIKKGIETERLQLKEVKISLQQR